MCGLNSSTIQKRLLPEKDAAAKQAEYLNLSKPTASRDRGEVHVMTGGMAQNVGNKPKFMKGKQQFQRSPRTHIYSA